MNKSFKWVTRVSADWLKNQCTTIQKAKQIHAFLLRNSLIQENHLVSKLISSLAILRGDLSYAQKLFDQIPQPDMFMWNTMIRGYAKSHTPFQAVSLYHLMIQLDMKPDNFTYPFVLTACAHLQSEILGRKFHCEVLKIGLLCDVFVLNSLIQMYLKCELFSDAQKLFDGSLQRDVVSWNTMIGGYVQGSLYEQAFHLFDVMVSMKDMHPDSVTLLSIISACTNSRNLDRGKIIHMYSKNIGLDKELSVANAILDMYCKCGDMISAWKLFDEMQNRDLLTWTSLMSGLSESYYFQESLQLFRQMQLEKIQPDEFTLVTALSSCAHIGALDQGKYIHFLMQKHKLHNDVVLGTALVDMYAKCGSIDLAFQVFNQMISRNVFTWNAMIRGLAMNGNGLHALDLFARMTNDRIVPDDVTFISILSACSHAGLIEQGFHIFNTMQEVHQMQPRMEHFGCMVDMLCRAKLFDRALYFILNMPISPNSILWATLLNSCRVHGDLDLAEKIGKHVIEMEPNSCGRYIQLSNTYATAGRWNDVVYIRNQMNSNGIGKIPGLSWIEVSGNIHQFASGDKSHHQIEGIYLMVEEMKRKVKLVGHVTQISDVHIDIEEEEKEHSVFLHSEKLAVAFGLMSTKPGMPIRIVKNLRVCNDCHSFLKAASRVFNREIIARDRNRFHHFEKGSCSCMDFW